MSWFLQEKLCNFFVDVSNLLCSDIVINQYILITLLERKEYMPKNKHRTSFVARMEHAFSQPPANCGMKLLPEERLADTLNIGMRRLRTILGDFEERGILERHRGKGTFLRRIPDMASYLTNSDIPDHEVIDPHVLFDFKSKLSMEYGKEFGGKRDAKGYAFKLWGNLSRGVYAKVLGGMTSFCNEMGHEITVYSWRGAGGVLLSDDALYRMLRENPGDGYMIDASPNVLKRINIFIEVAREQKVPILFFLTGSLPMDYQPVMVMDCEEAVCRAVYFLANEGFKKIGMISSISGDMNARLLTYAYEHSMVQAGSEYRRIMQTDYAIGDIIDNTMKLLSSEDRPDAIYIADDFLLDGVYQAMKMSNLVPGKDLGVITLSSVGHAVPPEINWSCLEVNHEDFGRRVVDELLLRIRNAASCAANVAVRAMWKPGDTHKAS